MSSGVKTLFLTPATFHAIHVVTEFPVIIYLHNIFF